MEARLPLDKLTKTKEALHEWSCKKSATLKELQSLIGTLQFACRVVVPGRAFLQRIVSLTRGISNSRWHIKLNTEFRKDVSMWLAFLENWNGVSFFLVDTVLSTPDLHPLYHPSISNGHLTAAVHHYFSASLASSTHRAYSVGQNHFITFCLLQGIIGPSSPLLPASEITLIYFAAHLAKTICYTTIKLYLLAVQDLHRQHNFPLKLSKMYRLQKVLTGIKRSQMPPKLTRYPTTIQILISLDQTQANFNQTFLYGLCSQCHYAGRFLESAKTMITSSGPDNSE